LNSSARLGRYPSIRRPLTGRIRFSSINYSSPQALVAIGVLIAMTIAGAALVWHTRRRVRRPNDTQVALAAMRILCAPNVSNEKMSATPAAGDHPAEITVYTLP